MATFHDHVIDVRDQTGAATPLRSAMQRDGLVIVDGVLDRAAVRSLSTSFLTVFHHRDSDPDGITRVEDRGAAAEAAGFAGLGVDDLQPHTDRSTVAKPPRIMMLVCARPAARGGRSYVIDGRQVYADLRKNDEDLLQSLCAPEAATFGGPDGYSGPIFESDTSGDVTVRLRMDTPARFSPAVEYRLADLRAVLERHKVFLELNSSQGYIINNRRWLHGRTAFEGQRLLYRILGDPLPQMEIPFGFRIDDLDNPLT